MRIDGSSGNFIASHVARAYGVPATRPTTPVAPAASTSPLAQIGPVNATLSSPAAAQSLVAGRVPGAIEFDGVSVPRMNPGAFSLYTRAADKIEAATAVQIGRSIDVKG